MDTFQYPTCILAQGIFSLEWVYRKHTFSKTTTYEEMLNYIIQPGRQQCFTLTGLDCSAIIFPLPKGKVEFIFQLSEALQISLVYFTVSKLWDYLQKQEFRINDVVVVNHLSDAFLLMITKLKVFIGQNISTGYNLKIILPYNKMNCMLLLKPFKIFLKN